MKWILLLIHKGRGRPTPSLRRYLHCPQGELWDFIAVAITSSWATPFPRTLTDSCLCHPEAWTCQVKSFLSFSLDQFVDLSLPSSIPLLPSLSGAGGFLRMGASQTQVLFASGCLLVSLRFVPSLCLPCPFPSPPAPPQLMKILKAVLFKKKKTSSFTLFHSPGNTLTFSWSLQLKESFLKELISTSSSFSPHSNWDTSLCTCHRAQSSFAKWSFKS